MGSISIKNKVIIKSTSGGSAMMMSVNIYRIINGDSSVQLVFMYSSQLEEGYGFD